MLAGLFEVVRRTFGFRIEEKQILEATDTDRKSNG